MEVKRIFAEIGQLPVSLGFCGLSLLNSKCIRRMPRPAVLRITLVVRRTNILCLASCPVIFFLTGDLSSIYGLKQRSADYSPPMCLSFRCSTIHRPSTGEPWILFGGSPMGTLVFQFEPQLSI
ncbi:hypothetical protein HAX54_050605 [Datura stramonium]|uniref:Uncharacterized protein n=1 Tax=Datura stramonium TaxID=4076 RepID=A0ABS8WQF7_DATST|nr:hypothetical protein [Datura stramonium]